MLRIKLFDPPTLAPGEELADWQIYKALHSVIQKRGFGRVPWAARRRSAGRRGWFADGDGLLGHQDAEASARFRR